MGDTAINVPVETLTHELQQLHDMVPAAVESLSDVGRGDDAAELERVYDEHISGVEAEYPEGPQFAAYVSMPMDDWRTTISGLRRVTDEEGRPRVYHLQNKLFQRLEGRAEEL